MVPDIRASARPLGAATRPSRRAVARHEAGHALLREFEYPGDVDYVEINDDGGRCVGKGPRIDDYVTWGTLASAKRNSTALLRVLVAGHAAEGASVWWSLSAHPGDEATDDASRVWMIAERLARREAKEDQRSIRGDRLYERTMKIIRRERAAVGRSLRAHATELDALTAALLERDHLSGDEVRTIIEHTRERSALRRAA